VAIEKQALMLHVLEISGLEFS